MNWTWLVLLVVLSLATFRLTRLITTDDFPLVRIPREWIVGQKEPDHMRWDEDSHTWEQPRYHGHEGKWYYWLGELITCPWCASGWVSLGLVLAVAWLTPRDAPVVDWLLLWWATWGAGSVPAAKIE